MLQQRAAIRSHIESSRGATPVALKIRHHGDFHLGQVLMVKDDAFIIDFEGEPRRSLAERRAKAPAARDVAGCCRSIDYAASAALRRMTDITPDEHARLIQDVRRWSGILTETYLDAYRSAVKDSPLWPQDPQAADDLLEFFLLEKAFYEIEYEISNRPTWTAIPVEATVRILERRGAIVT
jgi:maltose alpha-D-glucosyltransferase/alpha-amylase